MKKQIVNFSNHFTENGIKELPFRMDVIGIAEGAMAPIMWQRQSNFEKEINEIDTKPGQYNFDIKLLIEKLRKFE